ncbi:Zn(II)2Cys6 transcription factor [Aspergillus homomorphus CBS 101889]|uniref:Zn(2)-C6 fungal-type domain-containing protein n=1 Tax=Aspergillus homomorphus (strain CBS 101889) TaxID=1450537 RepID=A0A395HYH3_ASPHC|nr:hypothetical protein BO97DRAFT_391452 [Aspergillus homomorphus CBS 101889]RAL11918.1 hypothetical protein BO97DRAFT_391452 [Aspergillus homomorphus CBS 101889]
MRGCLTCRQRHIKCDKTEDQCLRCRRSGRECIPAPTKPEEVTFRHGQNPSLRPSGPPRYGESDLVFPTDQVWVSLPTQVSFEDETDRTAADYRVVSLDGSPFHLKHAPENLPSSPNGALHSPFASHSLQSPNFAGPSRARSVQRPVVPHIPFPSTDFASAQKLRSFNEAFLLRHFRKTLGPWLDVCDSQSHFSVDVAERAPAHPLLLYACLAISARHLSYTNNTVPPETADGYHERCIEILKTVLENRDYGISIDILLTSTVILRFFEQISSHSPSNDLQSHLLAGSVYISSQLDCAVSGGLAEASFWVFVMQDIQFALMFQRPLRLTLSPFAEKLYPAWQHRTAQDDRDWTHKAIWLLAETINYCYGAENSVHIDPIDGNALRQRVNAWERMKPDTFRPLHYSGRDPGCGRPFPVIWFTNTLHAAAIQHISMAKILFQQHELQAMQPMPQIREAIQGFEDEIILNLGTIFGIALSAENDLALRIMAGHALCACGTWIRDSLAQTCLLDLLRRTEVENGWPWAFVIQKLSQEWHQTAR